MGQAVFVILTLLGGISLCLYGMTVMSEGILKMFGSQMRASLRNLTNHRIAGFWFGDWITSLIQSSSAAIMMAVGFVSSGLLTLPQSIAFIMGANVGTTITAWIVALFGYYVPIGYLAIPLVLFGVPFFFSGHARRKPVGEILVGIALMVLGFTLFIEHMPEPSDYPSAYSIIELLSSWSILSVLLFVVIGILFTILVQSSAATIILSMVMCASGWLSFPMASALVIGDNVGTTLTPIFGSSEANVSARRASYAHLIFNLVGMLWAIFLVFPISNMLLSAEGQAVSPVFLAFCIALFHTLFNLVTSVLLIGFIPQISRLLQVLVPVTNEDDEEVHLSFIHGGILSTSELSLEEAQKEIVLFGERCQTMLQYTIDFIHMPKNSDAFSHAFTRIERNEKITDRLELEIVRYLNSVDRSSLSEQVASRVLSLYKVVCELESIGDSCYKIARAVLRCKETGVVFIKMQNNNIDRMLELTQETMSLMVQLLKKRELTQSDMYRIYNQEDLVNNLRNLFRDQNIGNIQAGYYSFQSGVLYMEIVNGCEQICDFIVNELEALAEQDLEQLVIE